MGSETVERPKWGNKAEFLLTMVSYAVGLGNVWRFPYLCYKNGGGAFLIPYAIMLAVVGIPVFFLELSLGQYAGLGPTRVFRFSPIFKGLGWAMMLITFMLTCYYNVLCAYCLYYLYASMTSELPWASCANGNGTWATDQCVDVGNATAKNGTTFSPSEEYFYNHVLQISKGIGEHGTIPWYLLLALAIAWIVVGIVLIRGVSSLGKFVYVTSTFPYVMITILLINNCLQEGASKGIAFYLEPEWSKLADPSVWADAASQIFFSLSVCYGGIIAMSSFNEFNNNVYRDAIMVSLINCATSVYAGFAIFSALGHMAAIQGVPVANVTTQGPELAFVAYPQALATMPIAPLWSILFFIMMALLGFGSEFSNAETLIMGFVDVRPKWFTKWRLIGFRMCLFVFLFCMGLPEMTQGGLYFLSIVDANAGGYPLLIIGFLECVAISWVYGLDNFSQNIKEMIGHEPNYYFKIMWKFVTPVVLLALIVLKAIYDEKFVYEGYIYKQNPYNYPEWAYGIAYLMIVGPVVVVLGGAIYSLFHNGASELIRDTSRPSRNWGPQNGGNKTNITVDNTQTDVVIVSQRNSKEDFELIEKRSSLSTANLGAYDNAAFNAAIGQNPDAAKNDDKF